MVTVVKRWSDYDVGCGRTENLGSLLQVPLKIRMVWKIKDINERLGTCLPETVTRNVKSSCNDNEV